MRTLLLGIFCTMLAFSQTNAAHKEKASTATQKPLVTFVELGSVNCVPCKMMQPVMKAVEEKYNGKVKVVFHDVWTKDGAKHGERYRIRVIPTQVFLDANGKEFFRHEGFFPEKDIDALLEKQWSK
ncbi:MAG: thioredoxin family protein [Spirochaetes bacterium]|nr:thioredoxin family protein [Spirochaetota bacterium]